MIWLLAGLIARRLTKYQFGPAVLGICVQVVPPLTVLKMPAPRIAAVFEDPSTDSKKPSPVPAYSTFGSVGSIAMQPTASVAMKSSSGSHDVPPLVVFQIPPLTEPTQIVFVCVGCTMIDRIRPPTLPGPSHVHVIGSVRGPAGCAAIMSSRCRRARISASSGILPSSLRRWKYRKRAAAIGSSSLGRAGRSESIGSDVVASAGPRNSRCDAADGA